MRYAGLFLIVLMSATGLFFRGVSSQSQSEIGIAEGRQTKQTAAIRAKGRGLPRVSFADSIELAKK